MEVSILSKYEAEGSLGLSLAGRTKERAPSPLQDPLHGSSADRTRIPRAVVNLKNWLREHLASRTGVAAIKNGRGTGCRTLSTEHPPLDCTGKHRPDGLVQSPPLRPVQSTGLPGGMDSGSKQRLGGVDVSKACDARLVQETDLDRPTGGACAFDQDVRRKRILERFRSQGLQYVPTQLEASKLTRILEHQRDGSQIEDRGHMTRRGNLTATGPNAPGHSEMEQQEQIRPSGIPPQPKHQILSPPSDFLDAVIPDLPSNLCGGVGPDHPGIAE